MGQSHFSKKEMNTMQAIPCKDHLGNEFPNKTAMCKHYGINRTTFDKRMNEKHMSLEETLTTPVRKQKPIPCKDHLGNEFPSKSAMCKHYGIDKKTYVDRIEKRHMSLKDALTTPVKKQHNGPCKDHMGNKFPSITAMCKHYGIGIDTFNKRINEKHMSLEDALTTPVKKQKPIPCKDHLGNEFPSKKAMCKYYGINPCTFKDRIDKKQMSLEDALTTPVKKRKKGSCKDHLGNEFPSETAMCKYYGINPCTFKDRIDKKQMSLKDALTTPTKKLQQSCKDYLGNEFPSEAAMCKQYGINQGTFGKRKNDSHISLEKALTMPARIKPIPCKDHMGNEFPSKTAMCKHYGISTTSFDKRINEKQMSLEDALTTPVAKQRKGSYKDHLGNEFPSKKAMCDYYNINTGTFDRRRKKQMSLKDILTTPARKLQTGSCKDHIGNEFPNKQAMCKYYGISYAAFKHRTNSNASIEEALGIIPYIYFKTKNTRITNNLFIKEVKSHQNKMLYAVCIYNDTETLLTHDEIIEIYRSETRSAP